jgi:putative transposase
MPQRKSFTKEFKAKVALEAIKSEKSIQELSQEFEVHPQQIKDWKKQLLDNIPEIFERPNKKRPNEEEAKSGQLYQHIGLLQVENEFLKKKYKQIYGHEPKI